jgi:hypothetical protein
MNEAKRTPGPWFWDCDGLWQRGDGKPYPKGAAVLTASYEYGSDPSVDCSDADADLIAAAPDLLEALVALVDSLAAADEEGLIEHAPQMEAARAAIAAATGETR